LLQTTLCSLASTDQSSQSFLNPFVQDSIVGYECNISMQGSKRVYAASVRHIMFKEAATHQEYKLSLCLSNVVLSIPNFDNEASNLVHRGAWHWAIYFAELISWVPEYWCLFL